MQVWHALIKTHLPSGNHQTCAELLQLVPSLNQLQLKEQQFPTTHNNYLLICMLQAISIPYCQVDMNVCLWLCMYVCMSTSFMLNSWETRGLFPIGNQWESAQGESNGHLFDDGTWPDDVITFKCFFCRSSYWNLMIFLTQWSSMLCAYRVYTDSWSRHYDVIILC